MRHVLIALFVCIASIAFAHDKPTGSLESAGGANSPKYTHATDCTAVTGAVQGDYCWEIDNDQLYACDTATCNGAGWIAAGGSAGTSYLDNGSGPMMRGISTGTCQSGWYTDTNRDNDKDVGEQCVSISQVKYATDYATGSTTGGIQEAFNSCDFGGGQTPDRPCVIILPPGTTNISTPIYFGDPEMDLASNAVIPGMPAFGWQVGTVIQGYGRSMEANDGQKTTAQSGTILRYTGQEPTAYVGVTVSINAAAAGEATITCASCNFTTGNWAAGDVVELRSF